MPFTKGHPSYLTEESKRKISKNSARIWKGKHLSAETKKKLSRALKGKKAWNKGMKMGDEFAKKVSDRMKGKYIGDKHPQWKGTKLSYAGFHKWLGNHFKKEKCEKCGTTGGYRLEFALIHGKKYSRNREDYMVLCTKCHRNYDFIAPWNKGKKTGIVTNGSFKKGMTPWNKGVSRATNEASARKNKY